MNDNNNEQNQQLIRIDTVAGKFVNFSGDEWKHVGLRFAVLLNISLFLFWENRSENNEKNAQNREKIAVE